MCVTKFLIYKCCQTIFILLVPSQKVHFKVPSHNVYYTGAVIQFLTGSSPLCVNTMSNSDRIDYTMNWQPLAPSQQQRHRIDILETHHANPPPPSFPHVFCIRATPTPHTSEPLYPHQTVHITPTLLLYILCFYVFCILCILHFIL